MDVAEYWRENFDLSYIVERVRIYTETDGWIMY